VALRVGDEFPGEPAPRRADRIERFVALGPAGQQPIVGRDGQDPAGIWKGDRPGVSVLVFRSNRAYVELAGEKFESYLREVGLESISKLRGLPLEIVPVSDPLSARPGSPLRVRVLHQGQPLGGALVIARSPAAAPEEQSVRTNAAGEAVLTPSSAGLWLVTCVHMTAAPAGVDAQWESLWASLTFSVE
jgi:uncharacterized GH25 family protein